MGKEKQNAKRRELNETERKTKSISNLKPSSCFSLFYTLYPRNTLPLICFLFPTNHNLPRNFDYSQSYMKQKEVSRKTQITKEKPKLSMLPHFKLHCPQCRGHNQIKEIKRLKLTTNEQNTCTRSNPKKKNDHSWEAVPKTKNASTHWKQS
ncbi:hypothetical protein M9H77_03605 [Catharanthus roseus]|uniref:Uncharacterized protein n=1 Tax=Catharanthus roseus TaxID=4058 RepID=A0ACC0CC00_CATRO|nr:hypothetical protein M9H77_03605 [Catharanthus roseus]